MRSNHVVVQYLSPITEIMSSSRPGRHLDPQSIMMRLRWLGINLLGSRNRALEELVSQIPPPVVAEMLGYSDQVTQRHAAEAGNTWMQYASNPDRTPAPTTHPGRTVATDEPDNLEADITDEPDDLQPDATREAGDLQTDVTDKPDDDAAADTLFDPTTSTSNRCRQQPTRSLKRRTPFEWPTNTSPTLCSRDASPACRGPKSLKHWASRTNSSTRAGRRVCAKLTNLQHPSSRTTPSRKYRSISNIRHLMDARPYWQQSHSCVGRPVS